MIKEYLVRYFKWEHKLMLNNGLQLINLKSANLSDVENLFTADNKSLFSTYNGFLAIAQLLNLKM